MTGEVLNTQDSEERRLSDLTLNELEMLRSQLDTGRASKLGKAYLRSIDQRIAELKKG